jgi:hypothetical protein
MDIILESKKNVSRSFTETVVTFETGFPEKKSLPVLFVIGAEIRFPE